LYTHKITHTAPVCPTICWNHLFKGKLFVVLLSAACPTMCVIGARELRAGLYPGRISGDLEREREGEIERVRYVEREGGRERERERERYPGPTACGSGMQAINILTSPLETAAFPFSKIFFPYLSDPSGEMHLSRLT